MDKLTAAAVQELLAEAGIEDIWGVTQHLEGYSLCIWIMSTNILPDAFVAKVFPLIPKFLVPGTPVKGLERWFLPLKVVPAEDISKKLTLAHIKHQQVEGPDKRGGYIVSFTINSDFPQIESLDTFKKRILETLPPELEAQALFEINGNREIYLSHK